MRDLINIVLNEGELTAPQKIGQWARAQGGTLGADRAVVKVKIDTSRYLANSGIFVVIAVKKHSAQGFDISVDLVLALVDQNDNIIPNKIQPLVDGHSWNREERGDQALAYAEQLKTTINKTITKAKLDAAIAELSR
jgi:hypothetical protein